jgi:microcystin-dependent protein
MEGTIGEIRFFAANFSPKTWAYCSGQTINIASNTALFSVLGVTFGGNGTTTFQLPNAQGRVTIGVGQGPGLPPYALGQMLGAETVALTSPQIPAHTHTAPALSASLKVSNAVGTNATPTAGASIAAADAGVLSFSSSTPDTILNGNTGAITGMTVNCGITGSNAPHANMMPYTVLSQIICMYGIYPSRN